MEDLLDAARTVIGCLKALPELQKARIAIIGGLALYHYAPYHRNTKDVDILIFDRDRSISPLKVEAALASRFPEDFEKRAEPVNFCLSIPDTAKVDFVPQEWVPYLPADAATLEEVDVEDANDANCLVHILSRQGPIALDDAQKLAVLSGLDGVLEHPGKTREWWESTLGLSD